MRNRDCENCSSLTKTKKKKRKKKAHFCRNLVNLQQANGICLKHDLCGLITQKQDLSAHQSVSHFFPSPIKETYYKSVNISFRYSPNPHHHYTRSLTIQERCEQGVRPLLFRRVPGHCRVPAPPSVFQRHWHVPVPSPKRSCSWVCST